jgi:hypothetical protein
MPRGYGEGQEDARETDDRPCERLGGHEGVVRIDGGDAPGIGQVRPDPAVIAVSSAGRAAPEHHGVGLVGSEDRAIAIDEAGAEGVCARYLRDNAR